MLMKRLFALLFLLCFFTSYSQNNNQLWRSFFSYNSIRDISQSDHRIYAGAESAMFSKNVLTNELRTITSVNGLKTETITAIYHSPGYNKTLIGNQNGLLLVINPDNSIVTKIDIIQEATVPPNKKKINHIYEYQGKVYIGCDFGIAVFNLATMEFGDTFYLGPSGSEIPVIQTAVYNGTIYAATLTNGLRIASINNPNLNDYTQWTEIVSGPFEGVTSFNGSLFWAQYGSVVKDGSTFFVSMPSQIVDLREANGYLIVMSKERVNVYNSQFVQIAQVNLIPDEEVTFTCATVVTQKLFIGTDEKGVFSTPLDFIQFENITPDGPLRNNVFSIEKSPAALWAVFGGYSAYYEPNYSRYGISRFTEQGWIHIPYEEFEDLNQNENGGIFSLSDITINPNNQREVWISSFHSGLLKIVNGEPVDFFDHENTNEGSSEGLTSLIDPGFPSFRSIRVIGPAYDRQGNLWMMNTRVAKPLKVLKPGGDWDSYSLTEAIGNNYFGVEYDKMVIDKNGTKWIPSSNKGVIAFNEAFGPKILQIAEGDGNLPANGVRSLAIDNNNQLWIGTIRGLRVLTGVDRFLTEDELTTRSIIIMDDGLAQELMYEQTITDIVVDGANNKWIATGSAGAFLVSPNGQQTLFHFTRDNSPLPSNTINDIVVDPETGEVFFATDKGMVSYQGTSTKAEDNLDKVYVFPNPVRPDFYGEVNISGLMDNVNVKITDIEGNLVYETTSEGGTVLWDTTAFGKHRVASGVYMIFIASEDGTKTKVKKVMIIR
jgi:ligand-binding sensor domain-containing protein